MQVINSQQPVYTYKRPMGSKKHCGRLLRRSSRGTSGSFCHGCSRFITLIFRKTNLTLLVFHTWTRNIHGPLCLLPSRQQLLRACYMRLYCRTSRLGMGILLAQYLLRCCACLFVLFYGGDKLRAWSLEWDCRQRCWTFNWSWASWQRKGTA